MARKYNSYNRGDILVQVKNLPYERSLRWPHGVVVVQDGERTRDFTPAWILVKGLDSNGREIQWSDTWTYKRCFATHRIVDYRIDQEPMEDEEVLG